MIETAVETIGEDGIPRTYRREPNDPLWIADGAGTWVERLIRADVDRVWEIVTDINVPAQFSTEFLGAEWVSDGPALGARFKGRNQHKAIGEWEVDVYVTRWAPKREFGWATSNPDRPGSSWCFGLTPVDGGVVLRFQMEIGPGPSGLTYAVLSNEPELEPRIIHRRIDEHYANMTRTIDGIRDLAEAS